MPQIKQLDLTIIVSEDDKECGAAVVELHVGTAIYRWEYGAGQDWEDPSIHRFSVQGLNIDTSGKALKCFGNLEERPGEVNIDATLQWDVVFTQDGGPQIKFGGRKAYETGIGSTRLELARL